LQAIHEKIQLLGFKDCHAKIRHVDCQETIGNAVVIQVLVSIQRKASIHSDTLSIAAYCHFCPSATSRSLLYRDVNISALPVVVS